MFGSLLHVLAKEVPHQLRDLVAVRLKGKVPGIEEVEFERLQVALVWLRPGGRDDLVVLPPRDQHGRAGCSGRPPPPPPAGAAGARGSPPASSDRAADCCRS